MKEQYAVCHLQRGSDSGMSCHIERKDANGKTYVPDNADSRRTHLNREQVSFPDGVRNRTEAIQYRIDHAGLTRKVAGNQCKTIRIILTGVVFTYVVLTLSDRPSHLQRTSYPLFI